MWLYSEASLSKLDAVQSHLAETGKELQREIAALQEDLQKEQDPNRMQAIQEMISVRYCGFAAYDPFRQRC